MACSQLQAMSQLVDSVNRLAEVNARKMMIEKKDSKSLLEFRKEEAEKMQEHEKYMAELYLRMMNHVHSTNPNPFAHNQLSRSFISPSEFTPPMKHFNQFQTSSTQPLDGKSYPFQFAQINNK